MSKETTTVEQVEVDIADILNIGASAMLPSSDTEVKPSMFSRKTEDLSFLNEPITKDPLEDKEDSKDTGAAASTASPVITNSEIDEIVPIGEELKNQGGRPKTDKQALVELANKLIEKKLLVPFEEDKPISEYTTKDFEELFEANAQENERKIGGKIAQQFFEGLPEEFQFAHEYVQNGGRDIKGLFKSLAHVEEVRQMDPANENDAKHISRSYLQATNFGNAEEIEEQLTEWEDANQLEKKAQGFKPKLAALTEQQVAYKLKQQAQLREQQAEQSRMYMDNVYKTLQPGDLNGLKLDKKTQNLLFSGLVQPNYASASGNQTNLLGHLLEKYQYIEPNHALLAEALWLLADPATYREKVREVTKKEVVIETVRKLKGEEANKIASHVPDDEKSPTARTLKGIQRPSGGFFKR